MSKTRRSSRRKTDARPSSSLPAPRDAAQPTSARPAPDHLDQLPVVGASSASLTSTPVRTEPKWAGVAFVLLCLLPIGAWAILARWYFVGDWIEVPHYALDKVPGNFSSPQIRGTAALFALLCLAYAASCALLTRAVRISKATKVGLLLGAAGSALTSALLYPVGAVDVFYYLAQLKSLYFYGDNPFTASFISRHPNDPLVPLAAFLDSPLVYGPAWAILGWLPAALGGTESVLRSLLGYKLFSLLAVAASAAIIFFAYRKPIPVSSNEGGVDAQRDELSTSSDARRWLGLCLFVGNPLIWYEAVANAHNDVVMAPFVLGAVAAFWRRSWWALPLLVLGALVKQSALPLAYILLVWMVRERWPAKTIALSCASAALVALALVAPFWSGGAMAQGLKQAVAISQGLNTGSLASLAREYLQGQGASEATLASVKLGLIVAFALFALAAPWLLRRFEHTLVAVLCVFYLCVGSLFSWYLIPIIGLLALSCARQPDRLALAYLFPATLLALLFNPLSVWAWFDRQMSPFHIHLGESLLLAVPMLLFIGFALSFTFKRQHTPRPAPPPL